MELVKQKLQDELGEVIKIMEVSSRSDETFWRSQAIQLQKKLDVLNEKNKTEEKNTNNKSTATTIPSASLEKNSILASTVTSPPLKQAASSSQKSILKTSSSSSPRRKSKKEKSVTLSPVMSQKSDFSHISVQKVISTNKLQNVARVIAPATLPEGYEFEAKLGNQKFTARVVSEIRILTKIERILSINPFTLLLILLTIIEYVYPFSFSLALRYNMIASWWSTKRSNFSYRNDRIKES